MIKNFLIILLFLVSCSPQTHRPVNEDIVKQSYADGTPCVIWHYDENGVAVWEKRMHEGGTAIMAEGPLKDTLRDGFWKGYYPTGELMSEGRFVKGKRHGAGKIYFKNGQISIENHYTEGKMSDQWVYYNDDERHTVNRVINY